MVTALLRRTPLRRFSRLNPVSAKRQREREIYNTAKHTACIRDNFTCQAKAHGFLPDVECFGAIHAHHVAPRARRPDLRNDHNNLVLLCAVHHSCVHDMPKEATSCGLLH